MKLLFYLHHPAQFYMFRHIIETMKKKHEVIILATKKDILLRLLDDHGFSYVNVLPDGRRDGKLGIALGLLKQDLRLLKICRKFKPDLLIGTSTEITHIGKLLRIPSLFFIEDDIQVVPLVGLLAHPFATKIISPVECDTGKWDGKTIRYHGYQKLAYLHPNYFKPDIDIVKKYLDPGQPFFIIRLSKLNAHHDSGVGGVSNVLLRKIVSLLETRGKVLISSEAEIPAEFVAHNLAINPIDIHHLLYYADLFIGDSQSMAVESAMLGTPSIRISDFSGRISVLEALEHKYRLTFGIKPQNEAAVITKITELLSLPDMKNEFQVRRKKMLAEKIDVTAFLIWFIENYPQSDLTMKNDNTYQKNFT